MLWQWALFLFLVIYMPLSLASGSSSSSSLVSTLTQLVPYTVPLLVAGRMSQTLRYYYRFALYCTTLGLTSVWAVVLSLAMSVTPERASIQHYVARSFYYFASPIVGWNLKIEGAEHLKNDTPVVLVGNHQSMIDILYLGRIFPKRTSVMAKRELKWSPFLGQFMLLSNAVFVDRKNREDAVKTFSKAASSMKAQNTSIFIFAEGTRTNSPNPTMLPFKKGAFHLAVQGQFPIVPIVMENYHHLYSGKQKRFERGDLTIRVLPPISTQGKTSSSEDIEALVMETREKMIETLKDLSTRRDSTAPKRIE